MILGLRALSLVGTAALAGCRLAHPTPQVLPDSKPQRTPYPDYPAPDDPLAAAPCSVKSGPDVVLRDVPDVDILLALHGNMKFLREANPVFLCGLERIDLLGDDAYRRSAAPEYTRRSVGLYTPHDRVIRIKASEGLTLTHEVGHHIHNLGTFAPTVRAFLAQSWAVDPDSGGRKPRCAGPDCFLNDAAASKPTEDWARTFERVLLRPIETGVATNFSLNGPTPMQEKIRLIRSIAKLAEPVKGIVRFGKARVMEVAEALKLKEDNDSQAMPASLPGDKVRRIFVAGKSSVQRSVWENRRRPFLAGDFVVFPVFQGERKTLGFFVYDLSKDRFLPVELSLEDIPEEFQKAAATFSDLRVIEENGGLALIGFREESPTLVAPVDFRF